MSQRLVFCRLNYIEISAYILCIWLILYEGEVKNDAKIKCITLKMEVNYKTALKGSSIVKFYFLLLAVRKLIIGFELNIF